MFTNYFTKSRQTYKGEIQWRLDSNVRNTCYKVLSIVIKHLHIV